MHPDAHSESMLEGGGGVWHAALDLLFSSAAGGAYPYVSLSEGGGMGGRFQGGTPPPPMVVSRACFSGEDEGGTEPPNTHSLKTNLDPKSTLNKRPPTGPTQDPLRDTWSICGLFTEPWTVTRLFFTARCSVDLLLKVRQAAVLTPPFLFLHRRRVVVVKTLGIRMAFTFAQPPERRCGTRAAGPKWRSRRSPPPVRSSEAWDSPPG